MIKISFTWNQPDSRRRRRCVPIPQLIAIASLQATSEHRGDHSQGGAGPWEGASGRDPPRRADAELQRANAGTAHRGTEDSACPGVFRSVLGPGSSLFRRADGIQLESKCLLHVQETEQGS